MNTYELKPHQIQILNEVKSLPINNLHYVVIQQSLLHKPMTLPELKKCINRSLKRYTQHYLSYNYKKGMENKLFQYYCFFETSKEFNLSQNTQDIFTQDFELNFHFHLFISSRYNVSFVNLIYNLFEELTSIPTKRKSLKKFDYKKIDKLEDNFILYHTKQIKDRFSSELIMKNVI